MPKDVLGKKKHTILPREASELQERPMVALFSKGV